MKITQDVREYAAQKEIDEQAALGVGMKEKAEEYYGRAPSALWLIQRFDIESKPRRATRNTRVSARLL